MRRWKEGTGGVRLVYGTCGLGMVASTDAASGCRVPGKKAETDTSADADSDADKPTAEERLAKALLEARVKVLAGFKVCTQCARTAQGQRACACKLCRSLYGKPLLRTGIFYKEASACNAAHRHSASF